MYFPTNEIGGDTGFYCNKLCFQPKNRSMSALSCTGEGYLGFFVTNVTLAVKDPK